MTPDDAVQFFRALLEEVPMESFSIGLAPPGVRLNVMNEYIELFARKVIPHF